MRNMIVKWLLWLWSNEDGFFGIGMGPSGQEESTYGTLAGAGLFGVSQGENAILKSNNFWSAILSGDESKISQVLGPEISGINKQAQQRKKTTAEFGNRSGGNNAVMNSLDDSVTSSIRDMVSKLTGTAASSLGSSGASLFGTGVGATGEAFDAAAVMQRQNQAKWQDIFNSAAAVAAGVAGLPGVGAGATTGLLGAAGALQS